MNKTNYNVTSLDVRAQASIKVPRIIALERAAQRFFIVSGTNQGMTFVDKVTQRTLNVHNVVEYINSHSSDPVGWKEINDYKHWRSLLPQPEYLPNQPSIIELEPGLCVANLWSPPTIQPDPSADLWPFQNFMAYAFGEKEAEYIIKWLAWQYQHPLKKPHTGLFIYGPQGSGKGFFADILSAVFGNSAITRLSDSGQLTSMSHVDLWQRTLLICEEVYFPKNKKLANSIKAYMGSDKTSADRKNAHFAEYRIPANPIFFSNHPPSFLEHDDRRWFVREMRKQPETSYYTLLYRWLEGSGASAVAHLLATTDLSDFKLSDRPLMTPEKQQAMGVATSEAVLILAGEIEAALQNEGCVFRPLLFNKDYRNRMPHICTQVGLKAVDLNSISGRERTKATGFTEAECRRLYVPEDAEVFQNKAHSNAWWIRCVRLGVDSALSDQKVPYL